MSSPTTLSTSSGSSASTPWEALESRSTSLNHIRLEKDKLSIFDAILSNNLDLVFEIVENGGDINAKNDVGQTPLHTAVQLGDLLMIEAVLDLGANCNSTDSGGQTPTHWAVLSTNNAILKLILDVGRPDVNMRDYDVEYTPLHCACLVGDAKAVELLLQAGAMIEVCDSNGNYPLHQACEEGNNDVVTMLLRYGARVDVCRENGITPLHIVACSDDVDIVINLITHGASLVSLDNNGRTPLAVAVDTGSLPVITVLLDALYCSGKRPSLQEQRSLFHARSTVWTVLEEGDWVLAPRTFPRSHSQASLGTEEGRETLYSMAVTLNHSFSVLNGRPQSNHDSDPDQPPPLLHKQLSRVTSGAQINYILNASLSPLYLAVLRDRIDVVHLLLRYGGDPMTRYRGYTLLHYAVLHNDAKVTRSLLSQTNCNVNAKGCHQNTPLHLACKTNINIYFERDRRSSLSAGVAMVDNIRGDYRSHSNQNTNINVELVSLLIGSGADINALNELGLPALSIQNIRIINQISAELVAKYSIVLRVRRRRHTLKFAIDNINKKELQVAELNLEKTGSTSPTPESTASPCSLSDVGGVDFARSSERSSLAGAASLLEKTLTSMDIYRESLDLKGQVLQDLMFSSQQGNHSPSRELATQNYASHIIKDAVCTPRPIAISNLASTVETHKCRDPGHTDVNHSQCQTSYDNLLIQKTIKRRPGANLSIPHHRQETSVSTMSNDCGSPNGTMPARPAPLNLTTASTGGCAPSSLSSSLSSLQFSSPDAGCPDRSFTRTSPAQRRVASRSVQQISQSLHREEKKVDGDSPSSSSASPSDDNSGSTTNERLDLNPNLSPCHPSPRKVAMPSCMQLKTSLSPSSPSTSIQERFECQKQSGSSPILAQTVAQSMASASPSALRFEENQRSRPFDLDSRQPVVDYTDVITHPIRRQVKAERHRFTSAMMKPSRSKRPDDAVPSLESSSSISDFSDTSSSDLYAKACLVTKDNVNMSAANLHGMEEQPVPKCATQKVHGIGANPDGTSSPPVSSDISCIPQRNPQLIRRPRVIDTAPVDEEQDDDITSNVDSDCMTAESSFDRCVDLPINKLLTAIRTGRRLSSIAKLLFVNTDVNPTPIPVNAAISPLPIRSDDTPHASTESGTTTVSNVLSNNSVRSMTTATPVGYNNTSVIGPWNRDTHSFCATSGTVGKTLQTKELLRRYNTMAEFILKTLKSFYILEETEYLNDLTLSNMFAIIMWQCRSVAMLEVVITALMTEHVNPRKMPRLMVRNVKSILRLIAAECFSIGQIPPQISSEDIDERKRVMRVFFSSPFGGMEKERELLTANHFLNLQSLCRQKGIIFRVVDLRWGIPKKYSDDEKLVIQICLSEIDRCGVFVGFYGARYGWHDDEMLQQNIDRALPSYPWLAQYRDRSATEIEFLHGYLNNPTARKGIFFFRDPAYDAEMADLNPSERRKYVSESESAGMRLQRLRQQVRTSPNAVVVDYNDPMDGSQRVYDALKDLILSEYSSEQPSQHERENILQDSFSKARTRLYIGQEGLLEDLTNHVNRVGGPIVVTGEIGCGKSALISNWAMEYMDNNVGSVVFSHYVGCTPASSDVLSMLDRLLNVLNVDVDGEEIPVEYDKICEILPKLLLLKVNSINSDGGDESDPGMDGAPGDRHVISTTPSNKDCKNKLIIIIDALHQLVNMNRAHELSWLPNQYPAGVSVIVSANRGKEMDEMMCRGWPTLVVPSLSDAIRADILSKYLEDRSKVLDDQHVVSILSCDATRNPLYLRVLLDELCVVKDFYELGRRIENYLQAQNASELFAMVLERLEMDYSDARPGEALSLIWAAREGLSEEELIDILQLQGKEGIWSVLYSAMEEMLVKRSGLLDFYHDYMRQAVKMRYLNSEEDVLSAHIKIANFFTLKGKSVVDRRVAIELPFHEVKLQRWEQLAHRLCDLGFLEMKFNYDTRFDILEDFKRCEEGLRQITRMVSEDHHGLHVGEGEHGQLLRRLQQFYRFALKEAHVLQRYPHFTLQQALNWPDRTWIATSARRMLHLRHHYDPAHTPVYENAIPDGYRIIVNLTKPERLDACIMTFLPSSELIPAELHGWICCYAPCGSRLALIPQTARESYVSVWDAATGDFKTKIFGRSVQNAWFTRDSRHLVLANGRGMIYEACALTGEITTVIREEDDDESQASYLSLVNVGVSRDMTTLCALFEHTVEIWDLTTRQVQYIHNYLRRFHVISVVPLSQDSVLCFLRQENELVVMDICTSVKVKVSLPLSPPIMSRLISDGRFIWASWSDGQAKIWVKDTQQVMASLPANDQGYVVSCAASIDGGLAVFGLTDGSIILYNCDLNAVVLTLKSSSNDSVVAVAFSHDSQTFLTVNATGMVRVWESVVATMEVSAHATTKIKCIHFNRDHNECLAIGIRLNDILDDSYYTTLSCVQTLWQRAITAVMIGLYGIREEVVVWGLLDATTKCKLRDRLYQPSHKQHLLDSRWSFSPLCTFLVSSGAYLGAVRVWDVSSGRLLRKLGGHTLEIIQWVFSTDEDLLVTGSMDCTVGVWSVATWTLVTALKGIGGPPQSLVFGLDNTRLFTGVCQGLGRLWKIESMRASGHVNVTHIGVVCTNATITPQICHSMGYDSSVGFASTVVFTDSEGKVTSYPSCVIVGCLDGTARVCNASTGAVLNELSGHADVVHIATVAPNQVVGCTGSSDGMIRIWNIRTGEWLMTLKGSERMFQKVNGCHFMDGGTTMCIVCAGTISVWDIVNCEFTSSITTFQDPEIGVACNNTMVVVKGSHAGVYEVVSGVQEAIEHSQTDGEWSTSCSKSESDAEWTLRCPAEPSRRRRTQPSRSRRCSTLVLADATSDFSVGNTFITRPRHRVQRKAVSTSDLHALTRCHRV